MNSNSKQLQDGKVTALAFSRKGDFVCLAIKEPVSLRIYKLNSNPTSIDSWTLIQSFQEHSQTISDIDFAPDDKIISTSHDRSVYVWRRNGEKWEKMLVNLDIKLSILVGKWAETSRKFAIGSACSTLALGFYNNVDLKCWAVITKEKLTKSPITTLSFHPSSNLLAVGSSDFSLKIVSSSFRSTKDQSIIASNVEVDYKGPFQAVTTSFDILFQIENVGSWINHVSWECGGQKLLVLPHGSKPKIFAIADTKQIVVGSDDVNWTGLPFLGGYINSKGQLLVGGFDKKVSKFSKKGVFTFDGNLQTNEKTNQSKVKKGLVSGFATGIEKKSSLFGDAPGQSQHLNATKVIQYKGNPVSWDINGIIHFWQ